MVKILFNNIRKSENYLKHFAYLFSDYDLFRKKHFSSLCLEQLQPVYPGSKLLLTHSATGALDMVAMLLDIQEGDEIILPSFTFVSTANAFVSKGATPVFIDIDPETLNMDISLVEAAITPQTKAVVAVHYAGNACDLKRLSEICQKHGLSLVEDAAMGYGNQYEGVALGSYGDFGVISFDITKQVSAVQGGLLLVNDPRFVQRAENIYHIGTDRSQFMEGNKSYYEWVDTGSKFQMNELNAAVLYEQLLHSDEQLEHNDTLAAAYFNALKNLKIFGSFQMTPVDQVSGHVHEFYLILESESVREKLSKDLAEAGIEALFHYIPLHDSIYGKKIGRSGKLPHTESIAARLLRLPLHAALTSEDVRYICSHIQTFFDGSK